MKNYEILDGLQREAQGMLKNAYDKGYKRGCEDCKADLNEEAYNKGLQHGQELRIKEAECAETCGMQRAWDVARKIVDLCSELTQEELGEIFGSFDVNDILNGLSAFEAVEKIEAWEKKQDVPDINDGNIEVGDECICNCPNKQKVVVTEVLEYEHHESWVTIMRKDGACYSRSSNGLTKTGNHYDIQSILDKMKEHEVEE